MKNNWNTLITLLNQCDEKSLKEFLDFFLTASEKKALADRVQLIKLLLEDKLTQREIASQYHISIAKITRGSNMLKGLSDKKREHLKAIIFN